MQNLHVTRKFLCPALPPTFLRREALVDKVNAAIMGSTRDPHERLPEYKLILLYAPAGYGKTTLLTEIALRSPLPCCWYHLDPADTDKLTFLRSLIESLLSRFPQLETPLRALITSITTLDIDTLVNVHYFKSVLDTLIDLVNAHTAERFVLFLCNYQEINENPGINEIVNRLLRSGFERGLIVIESRVIPNLDFVRLFARNEAFSLGSNDLRFTAQDICDLALLQNKVPLSYTEAEQIAASFDGWIAGILLGTHIRGTQFLQFHRDDRRYLFAYVVNEVFRKEGDIYLFLKQAAVLQQMTAAVCDELLEISDARERLVYLEQRGLFVKCHTSSTQIVYTCNSVLRSLLCEELQQEDPDCFLALHQRAAHIFLAVRDYEQAIYHAMETHLYDMAAGLIFETYEEVFAQGCVETLKRWIEALPADFTMSDPRLLLIQANITLLAGEHTRAFQLLDQATRSLHARGEESWPAAGVSLACMLDLARSKALFQAGVYQQAREICLQILEQLPEDEISVRTEAYIRLGTCLNLLGEIDVGIVHLHKALQIRERNTLNRQVANTHGALASAYSLLGNFLLAEHHLSRSIACYDALHDEWGRITSFTRRGIIKQRQGAFAEAEKDLAFALKLARTPPRYQQGEAYALANLADLLLVREYYERALVYAEDSLALAHQLKDARLVAYNLQTLAMAYLRRGHASTALLLVSEIDALVEQKHALSYERAIYVMTYGSILLDQQRFEEACVFLTEGEQLLQLMNLKQERLQVLMRLAACLLALKQTKAFEACLQKVTAFLLKYKEYDYLARLEIRHQPTLAPFLSALPREYPPGIAAEIEAEAETRAFQDVQPTGTVQGPTLVTEEATLRIVAFGDPAITLGNQPIAHWRMARAMELFFFFLHMDRSVRKEQIITALWAEVDEHTDHTLHTTIYYLRKIIGKACIHSHAGFYTMDLTQCYGTRVWYDVQEFQKHYMRGKRELENTNDALAREELTAMVGLYSGDYLQSFYSDWSIPRRDELRMMYLDAHRSLGQMSWRQRLWDESLFHWQQMLIVDNCLEDAHAGVIRCYMHQGKRSLALRQYQLCEETLQQELDIKPGQELHNLYQRLKEEY